MERMIAYCGVVCTECPAFIATQKKDREALKQVAVQWTQQFGVPITPEYCLCDGCQSSGGWLGGHCYECKIRACGIEKKVQNCAYCADYPCQELEEVFAFGPEAKATLEEIRQEL